MEAEAVEVEVFELKQGNTFVADNAVKFEK